MEGDNNHLTLLFMCACILGPCSFMVHVKVDLLSCFSSYFYSMYYIQNYKVTLTQAFVNFYGVKLQ